MIIEGDGGTIRFNSDLPLPTEGYYVGGSPSSPEFLGWWKDVETGLIHLDLVDWFPELDRARLEGRVRGEIAIYDIANAKEIRL